MLRSHKSRCEGVLRQEVLTGDALKTLGGSSFHRESNIRRRHSHWNVPLPRFYGGVGQQFLINLTREPPPPPGSLIRTALA